MNGYRIATQIDIPYILQLLTDGDIEVVLVRSLFRCNEPPYSLSEISRGPYRLTEEGLCGFSLDNEPCILRIADNSVHNVELKRGDAPWIAPEMSSIILLISE